MFLVEVYTENPIHYNQRLTYQSSFYIEPGCRVIVPLRNQKVFAFVDQCYEGEVNFETKPVIEVIDEKPILNQELLDLAQWLSYMTIAPLIRCLQAILPNPLRPKKSARKVQMVRMVKVNEGEYKLSQHQQHIFDDLKQQQELSYTQALKLYKTSLKTLIKNGAVVEYEIEKTYEDQNIELSSNPKLLTQDQQKAVDSIQLKSYSTSLLFGATGSGKTEVYLQVAQKVLDQKQQVLILVPEISLTPQMIERFQSRFGQDIGFYHSGLNDQEKYEQYQRVKNQEVDIVVGTRSCVFLPFSNLGLIVLDEEHDPSFKQESIPYYHAREVALHRAQTHNCPVILGSASPSLETYAKALKGVYQLLELPQRINQSFPDVKVIDMRAQLRQLKEEVISKSLDELIQTTLNRNEQIILLLNRRSYSPIVQCQNCFTPLECPHCDTTLAYHKDSQSYLCHTCGYQQSSNECPVCHHKAVIMKGVGTQRLQEIVEAKYPQARVGRLDADTSRLKNAHFRILKQFENRELDILVGTQMIAKGLDMPFVTLVGVLQADSALMHDDFSSTEKAFSLILQASGRAGRHDLDGQVIVQSFIPDHYAIQYALRQNYKGFFQHEMKYRHQGQYPPYNYFCEILLSHKAQEEISALSYKIVHVAKTLGLNTLGPAPLRKLSNLNRARIIIRSKDNLNMIEKLHQLQQELQLPKEKVKVVFNINPLHLSS